MRGVNRISTVQSAPGYRGTTVMYTPRPYPDKSRVLDVHQDWNAHSQHHWRTRDAAIGRGDAPLRKTIAHLIGDHEAGLLVNKVALTKAEAEVSAEIAWIENPTHYA